MIKSYRRRNFYAALDYRLPKSNKAILLDFTQDGNILPKNFPKVFLTIEKDMYKYSVNLWFGHRYDVLLVGDVKFGEGIRSCVSQFFTEIITVAHAVLPITHQKPVWHVARYAKGATKNYILIDVEPKQFAGFFLYERRRAWPTNITHDGFVSLVLQKDNVFPIIQHGLELI
jgi:hypothetical protein